MLRAATEIVGRCEKRVHELAKTHNVRIDTVPSDESGWAPPDDVTKALAAGGAPEPALAPTRATGAGNRADTGHKKNDDWQR